MIKLLKRLACRHSFIWSERRQRDICYDCGAVRPGADAALLSTRQEDEAIKPSPLQGKQPR